MVLAPSKVPRQLHASAVSPAAGSRLSLYTAGLPAIISRTRAAVSGAITLSTR
jgi:hypothetical protein